MAPVLFVQTDWNWKYSSISQCWGNGISALFQYSAWNVVWSTCFSWIQVSEKFRYSSILMSKSVLGMVQIPSWAAESHLLFYLDVQVSPGYGADSILGSWEPLSLVKTEWNWSRRILVVLSLKRVVCFFRGSTPVLSWCFAFTYLQNGLVLFPSFPLQSLCSHTGTLFSSFLFYILSWKTYSYSSCWFSELACYPL